MTAKKINEQETFESAMLKLEQIANELEQGEITLEESMDLFTRGIQLTKYCNQRIDEIEQKVQMLVNDSEGGMHEVEFEE
jgi:exodeoxyribonuclease VII small subunit